MEDNLAGVLNAFHDFRAVSSVHCGEREEVAIRGARLRKTHHVFRQQLLNLLVHSRVGGMFRGKPRWVDGLARFVESGFMKNRLGKWNNGFSGHEQSSFLRSFDFDWSQVYFD